MLFATSIVAFLGAAVAHKESTASDQTASKETLFTNTAAQDFYIVRHKFDGDSKCSQGHETQTDTFKISAFCDSVDGGYAKYSCFEDPTGLTMAISVIRTVYDNDQCLGGRDSIVSQSGQLSEFNNVCNGDAETFWQGPYSGSEVFECVRSDNLQVKVDESNTVARVAFENDGCTMAAANVIGAEVVHYNKCETFDVAEAYDGYGTYVAADFAGINSRKISDCGFDVQYFTDDNCQERKSALTESWATDANFDECEDLTGGGGRKLVTVNDFYDAVGSVRKFCANGDYGPYADKKLSDSVSSSLSMDGLMVKMQQTLNQGVAPVSSSQSAAQVNYFYLASYLSAGVLVGALVTAKFFKSRAQFEGVEMQSTHSNL